MTVSIIPPSIAPQALVTVLGVVYVHRKTPDGGDLYLTRYGAACADFLEIDNWYDRAWFVEHRVRLPGTSAVFRVPTKPIDGKSIDLVVKNCRVGEDVPLDTRTLEEFINAEFNSPWEEFSLVMEIQDGKYGSPHTPIRTQEPLAIYVPPETMQVWQSGRSADKIRRIEARHPGVSLDILRQYKLVYGWIHGRDVVEILEGLGYKNEALLEALTPMTKGAMVDLERHGYMMADMKPSHIVVGERDLGEVERLADNPAEGATRLRQLVDDGAYSVVDYELLCRTPAHEEEVLAERRHSYLVDQRDRFTVTELPDFLHAVEIMGVPYVYGRAEATGGRLWVVGSNNRLFDYFLPERWRKTHAWRLSENAEIYYTLTKDFIHVVWKTSRVGETPAVDPSDRRAGAIIEQGYNSPFEEAAIAHELARKGIGTVYVRAIYSTGTQKMEGSTDLRRYASHADLLDADGSPILRDDHNYITVRGYFNGSDRWVAGQSGAALCRPVDLGQATTLGLLPPGESRGVLDGICANLKIAGYDGSLLGMNDVLLAIQPDGALLRREDGELDSRISNLEWIRSIRSR